MSGRFAFNTAIAAVMELVNECYARRETAERREPALRDGHRRFADLPVRAALRRRRLRAAHRRAACGRSRGPTADPALLARDEVEIALQINGKLRDRMPAPASADRDAARVAGARTPARAGAHRRQGRGQGGRRPGQARQLRRSLTARCRARSRASPWSARAAKPAPAELAQAEEAGAAIAAAGAMLVCGGLGGVMEAACRGARSRGGLTIGLLPGDGRRRRERLGRARAADRAGRGAQRARRAGGRRGRRDRRRLGHAERDRARAAAPASRCSACAPGSSRARASRSTGVRAVDDAQTAVAEALRLAGRAMR